MLCLNNMVKQEEGAPAETREEVLYTQPGLTYANPVCLHVMTMELLTHLLT